MTRNVRGRSLKCMCKTYQNPNGQRTIARRRRVMYRVTPQTTATTSKGRTRPYLGKTNYHFTTPVTFTEIMRPVMLSLRIIGVSVPFSSGCRLWAIVVMLFRILYLGSCLSNMILNNSIAFDYISVLLTTASSIFAAGFLNFNCQEIRKTVDKLDSTLKHLLWSKATLRSHCRQIVGLTIVGWVFLILRWATVLSIVDNAPAHVQFQSIFYVNPPEHFSDLASYVCVALVSSLEAFFVQGALIFTPVLFMSLCLLLAGDFTEHNKSIVALAGQSSDLAGEFTRVRSFHERLCALVGYADSVFGKVIFFWFLFLVISACLDITQLFTDDTLLKNKTQDDVFFFSLKVIYSVFSFLGTCATAAKVSQEAHASLPTIHALTLRTSRMDLDTKLEVQFFLNRLTSPIIGLSGWNFFTINKGFILNVSAALVTYTVVVIQMNPKAMRVIHNIVAQTINNATNNVNNNDAAQQSNNSTNSTNSDVL